MCRGDFGQHGEVATQLLFGAPIRTGSHTFKPGDIFGVLGSEWTHAGRRVRSWAHVVEVPVETRGTFRMPFVDQPIDLLCVLVQARHHRKPGPVCDLVLRVEDLTQRGCIDRMPASFWTMAGLTAAAGMGIRRPPGMNKHSLEHETTAIDDH